MSRRIFSLFVVSVIALGIMIDATLASWAQDSGVATAVASVSPQSVAIGEPVTLTIEISSASSDYQPHTDAKLIIPNWEVQEAQLVEAPPEGTVRHWRYVIRMVSWQSGSITVPELDLGSVSTSPLTVEVTEPQTASQTEPSRPAISFSFERLLLRFFNSTYYTIGFFIFVVAVGYFVFPLLSKTSRHMKRQASFDTHLEFAKAHKMGGIVGWSIAEEAVRRYLIHTKSKISANMTLSEMANILREPWAGLLHQCEENKYKHPDPALEDKLTQELGEWIVRVSKIMTYDLDRY